MKKRINTIDGKILVQGGTDNELKSNEIRVNADKTLTERVNGEVVNVGGGSGAGVAKIVPLIEQCRVYWQNTVMGSHVEVRVPDENGQFINSPQAGGYLVVESPNLYLPTSSTNNHTWFWDNEIGGFRTEVFEAYETFSFSYIEGI